MAALLGVAFLSSGVIRYEIVRCRRPAALSGDVLSIWLLSGALAFVADRYGVF